MRTIAGGLMMSVAKKIEAEQIPLARAKLTFFDLVTQVEVKGEEVILTRHGKPVAKIVPMNEPLRESVVFGCLQGMITLNDPDEDFTVDSDAWGEISDLEGKSDGST